MFEPNNNYYANDPHLNRNEPNYENVTPPCESTESTQQHPETHAGPDGYYSYRGSELPKTEPVPSYIPQATYVPSMPPAAARPTPKKQRKAAKMAAAVAAIMLLSGGTGAGAAWMVLRNNATEPVAAPMQDTPVSASSQSVVKPAVYDSSTAAAVNGSITEIVKKAAGSVVEITTETKQTSFYAGQYVTQGAGSGVIIREDGYIVTNYHVIEDATSVTVRTQDGTEYDASLVGTDEQTDLAVIKIEAGGLPAVSFADSDQIEVGELAVAIGNPLGELGGTVTSGIISAKDRDITISGQSMTLLQTSAAVNPGNSGGGLFDRNGDLVGIVNAKSAGTEIEGLAFAIPANTVRKVVNDIVDNGYVTGRPQFGISVLEVNEPRTAMMYRLNEYGVYVAEVQLDNGFVAGDRLVSVDGTEISTSSDLSGILKSHEPGDTVSVTVKRDGKEVTFDVTLTEKAPAEVRKTVKPA